MGQRSAILEPAPEIWEPRPVQSHSNRHGLDRAANGSIVSRFPAQIDEEVNQQRTDPDGIIDEVGRDATARVAQRLLRLERETNQKINAMAESLRQEMSERLNDMAQQLSDRLAKLEDEMGRPRKRPRKDSGKDTFADTILQFQ